MFEIEELHVNIHVSETISIFNKTQKDTHIKNVIWKELITVLRTLIKIICNLTNNSINPK
jgi:hypothetical protein